LKKVIYLYKKIILKWEKIWTGIKNFVEKNSNRAPTY